MKKLLAVFAELFALCLLLMPERAMASASAAIALWATAVAPALFPFLAVLPLLTCWEARRAYNLLFGWMMRPALRLPGEMASAMLIGMAAGSPAGALAAARVAGEAGLELRALKRCVLAFTGLGPVFLLSGVGVAMFGSRQVGVTLVLAQLISQGTTAFVLRFCFRRDTAIVPRQEDSRTAHPIREAAMNVIQVCGFMTLFMVVAGMLAEVFGAKIGNILLYAMDFPSGAATAALLPAPLPARVALVCGMLGFGGMCIACQNMSVVGPLGVRWWEYLSAKTFSAGVCAAAGWLLCPRQTAVPVASFAANGAHGLRISALFAVFAAIPPMVILARSGFLNKTDRAK